MSGSLPRRALAAMFFAVTLGLVAALDAPPAAAQNPIADFFGSIFAPHPMKAPPAPRPIKPPAPKPVPKPPAPPRVKTTAQFTIVVIGDGAAGQLAHGLDDAFADDPRIAVLDKSRPETGLVRDDQFDWIKAARALAEGPKKIDAVVIMIGAEDNQKFRLGPDSPEPLSKPFNELYAKKVADLARIFQERKIPLIWVGLPIMRSQNLSAAALAFNEIDRQYAQGQGAHFVDLWEAFSDAQSAYRASGPDVSGKIVKLRGADGVSFTRAGGRTAAHFVEPELRKAIEAALTPPATPAAPEPPGAPAAPGPDQPTATPTAPATAPSAPTEVVAPPPIAKPLAGPVENLTTPPLSPGGALSSGEKPPGAGKAAAPPVQPAGAQNPARADDFSWPVK